MPTSDINNIAPIINETFRLNPKSILDLGAGSGKYGVLLREYLDIAHSRLDPDEWQVRIDAIEGFYDYITSIHTRVYDNIQIENFAEPNNWDKYRGYDLVLLIDSLEHLPKDIGFDLLHHLKMQNKHVIVSVPWGDNYLEQGAVNGNPLECHQAEWSPSDMIRNGGQELYRGVCVVSRFSVFNPDRPTQPTLYASH